jgi:hypothetical protein
MTTITNSCSLGAFGNSFNISISKLYDIYIQRTKPMTHQKNALPQNVFSVVNPMTHYKKHTHTIVASSYLSTADLFKLIRLFGH